MCFFPKLLRRDLPALRVPMATCLENPLAGGSGVMNRLFKQISFYIRGSLRLNYYGYIMNDH